MLWVVGTPIGNLGDLSDRAKEALNLCDLILCEDTRRSGILLHRFGIKKPLRSYHKFNEMKELKNILNDLKGGKQIALISDGGMPALSDPGEELIRSCHREKIPLSIVPGPSAVIGALILSGFPTIPFQFIGFLSKKEGDFKNQLIQIFHYRGTTVAFETPHRIVKTLKQLPPDLNLGIARELTKIHEECLIGSPQELLEAQSMQNPKGEITLIFAEHPFAASFPSLSLEEHVAHLEKIFKISRLDAIKCVSSLRKTSKKELYNKFNSTL